MKNFHATLPIALDGEELFKKKGLCEIGRLQHVGQVQMRMQPDHPFLVRKQPPEIRQDDSHLRNRIQ